MSKKKIFCIIIVVLCASCQEFTHKDILLSNDYIYFHDGSRRRIESREISYRNRILPTVTDYAFNKNFIIVEQKPNINHSIDFLGEGLLWRFEDYRYYEKDTNFFNRPNNAKFKGLIEKDTQFYKRFLEYGATDDESNNRAIGISMAEDLIKNDSFYSSIFKKEICYWIIDNVSDSLIGPLKMDEFLEKKKDLKIPENLKLKSEE